MQLKAVIKSLAEKFGITPQAVLQMYCLERLLERIAASERGGCFAKYRQYKTEGFLRYFHSLRNEEAGYRF